MKKNILRILLVLLVLLGASLACNRPTSESGQPPAAEPMSDEEFQRLQEKMAETLTGSSGGVTITITQQQINSIIAAKMEEQPEQILTEPSVALTNGNMEVYGKISQGGLSFKMKMVLKPTIDANGNPNLEVRDMSLSGIPIPDELKDQIGNLVDQAFREYLENQNNEFQVTNITIEEGKMIITGNVP